MARQKAVSALEQEHRIIHMVIASMVVLADRLETGREVKAETLRDASDFMQLVYKGHERKEELYLFPALQKKGVSVHSVPTRMLVEEHQRGRALVAGLEEAAAHSEVTPPVRASLVASLRGLAALYPLHIWQEDLLLFHQADNVLTREDDEELLAAFGAVDEEAGGQVRQRLERLAGKIQDETW